MRDVRLWARLARRREWARRVVAYNASALPYMRKEDQEKVLRALEMQGMELEMDESSIDAMEHRNAELVKRMAERKAALGKFKRQKRRRPAPSAKIRGI